MARYNPRLIYVVLDGGSDAPEYGPTSFELADTPNLDMLATRSKAGLVHVLGMGIAPQSDAATLSLLGYSPYKYHIGRGLLEALGIGIRVKPDYEVAFRGNLATVENLFDIVDRRCGRDISTDEARELLRSIEYLDLGVYDGYAYTYPAKAHRVVTIIGSRTYKLSPNVSNIDPAYRRVGFISEAVQNPGNKVVKCEPLDSSEASRITAELVNRYYELVYEALSRSEVNERRESQGRLKCNAILLRDAGVRPGNIPMFQHLYEFKMASVVEMPVEKGIANLIGLIIAEIKDYKDLETRYRAMAERAVEILEFADAVYVHIKGPDEPAHDGDKDRKVEIIELIDKYFFGVLLNKVEMEKSAFLITCDHSTPPELKSHSSHPVPLFLYKDGLKSDGLKGFSENEAARGSIGTLTGGWDVIPLVKRIIWG